MRILTLATLLGVLIAFGACDAIASGDCYVDDYKILKVVDKNGVEFEPQKMTLLEFGIFEKDYCGIPSDAVPDERSYRQAFGIPRIYPIFEISTNGIEDTRTSLAGNTRELPDHVSVGTDSLGIFSDELSMWPLYESEWR